MKKILLLMFANVLAVMAISSCGQTGHLYLPEKPSHTTQSSGKT